MHSIVEKIRHGSEKKQYVSAVFLDIEAAFHKVWHQDLLYKIKKLLSNTFYLLFKILFEEEFSTIKEIKAGVPQGNVPRPTLYNIFTSDIPQSNNEVMTATYADDIAILATSEMAIQMSH